MRYLPYDVYRSHHSDCTNGGVSATAKTIYVRCLEGFIDEKDAPEHLRFRVDKRSATYFAAVPIKIQEGMIGPMDGGNLASTSDSRGVGVLHVHDRFETPEMNEILSR